MQDRRRTAPCAGVGPYCRLEIPLGSLLDVTKHLGSVLSDSPLELLARLPLRRRVRGAISAPLCSGEAERESEAFLPFALERLRPRRRVVAKRERLLLLRGEGVNPPLDAGACGRGLLRAVVEELDLATGDGVDLRGAKLALVMRTARGCLAHGAKTDSGGAIALGGNVDVEGVLGHGGSRS